MINAIIFDLGGVLFSNGTKSFITYLCDTYHLDRADVEEVVDGPLGSKYREAKITREEFWRQVIQKFGIQASEVDLVNAWISRYELNTETKDLIFTLKKKYKIYYLSDNVRERAEALDKKFQFLTLFDGGIFSHEVGMRKPNPELYERILALAGVVGSQAVYIDDKEPFLVPARALGMHTIHFVDPTQLKGDLTTILEPTPK